MMASFNFLHRVIVLVSLAFGLKRKEEQEAGERELSRFVTFM
jgi:hypothetical protein